MHALRAGYRLQVQIMRADPDTLMTLAISPVFSLVFLMLVRSAGRADLLPHAVLVGPIIGLWSMALFVAGEIVDSDRASGLLEPAMSVPGSFPSALLGRVLAVTSVALVTFPQSWAMAFAVFRVFVPIPHPVAFLVVTLVAGAAVSGAALLMAALFVAARSARIFQNSLTYPFYVLGGVAVPVEMLPGWLQAPSRLVFLSWASDLWRDTLGVGAVRAFWPRLLVVAGLGGLCLVAGQRVLSLMIHRVRALGSATYA